MGILLEGGGSRTWAALSDGSRVLATANGPSTNPRSVGEDQAEHTLTALISQITTAHEPPAIGYLTAAHGAASTNHAAHQYAKLMQRACIRAHLNPVTIRLSNDMTPVLLAADTPTVCAIIAGTGTGFAARHDQTFARASGLEWLLSDEGGAHDLAVAGLRAAIRACDGRGPATILTDLARTWSNHPELPLPDALFDTVYAAHAKPRVATFAVEILHTAAADPVAATLVLGAAQELAVGAQAVCRRVGLPPGAALTIVLSGSLLTGTTLLTDSLMARLREHLNVTTVRHHDGENDHPAAMLALHHTWQTTPHALLDIAQALPTVTLPPTHPGTATTSPTLPETTPLP
jgi:N-acetylglucosamine kinase-like BadF-type ATPase